MKVITRKNLYYLGHSFRKSGKPTYREIYLGKTIPKNIENIKNEFLRKCMEEELFKKLNKIQNNFKKEWKTLPESIKRKNIIELSVNFTYNSNAIEGSTITIDETEDIIKNQISPNKPISEVKKTINHSKTFLKAINEKNITIKIINKWHKNIFSETKKDIAGKIRTYLVKVGNYLAPDWQDVTKLLKEFFKWYDNNEQTMHPIELAARAHYKFEKIHPFGDGNGRIGRLIIANILWQKKYPILTIDYKKRKSYYKALTKEENKFLQYFIRRYLTEFKRYEK